MTPEPIPWAYPGEHYQPEVTAGAGELRVQVGLPNEEPDQDDRTIVFTFNNEGLITDSYVSADQSVATSSLTYDEIYNALVGPGGDPWASDPDYPVEDWQYEVANGDTRRGYQEWLRARREEP